MQRTIEEIENEILIAKDNNPVLQEINTTSRFSPWKAIVYVMAYIVHTLEQVFALFKEDITQVVTNNRLGSLPWYAQVSKAFQLGDNLNEDLKYNTINTDLQIITRVAVNELPNSTLVVKVAKGKTQNELGSLTEQERKQFEAYMNKIKPAGVKIEVESQIADQVIVGANVFFNPIFSEDDIKDKLIKAIHEYCSHIDFGGQLNQNDMINRIRQEEGIEDFVIDIKEEDGVDVNQLKVKQAKKDKPVEVKRVLDLEAGYAVFDQVQSDFKYEAV